MLNVGKCILHKEINFIVTYNPTNKFRKNFYNTLTCMGLRLLFVFVIQQGCPNLLVKGQNRNYRLVVGP